VIIWPHVSSSTNGNIIVVAAPNDGATFYGSHSTWNGTTWSALVEHTEIGGPSGNFSTEAGPGGLVYIHGIDYNEPVAFSGNKLFVSTNNGSTFTLQSGSNGPPNCY
jgi:hypothetical protein